MKRVSYSLVGLLLYAVFFVTLAPATWVAWGVTRISHGALTLGDPQGTLWSGHGALIASASRRDLGRLRWAINPAWLPIGKIGATLDLSSPQLRAATKLRLGLGRVQIVGATARSSPEVATALYPPLALVGPEGDIEFRADRFSITRNAIEGEANLFWRDAAINVSNVRPLGSYQLQLRGNDRAVSVTLSTQGGALNLNGQGRWLPFDGGRLEFSGLARAIAKQNELVPLLALLGAKSTGEARLLIQTAFPFS